MYIIYVCVSYRYNSTRYIIIGTPYTYQKQVGTHELTTQGNHVYRLSCDTDSHGFVILWQ